jgi:1-acyl-sn-glycerol-3-phosphate acyltransferase
VSLYADLSFRAGKQLLRFLKEYHQHEVYGFENIPKTGPALVAFHHSLCTYDSFLVGVPIWDQLNREFRGLADRLIFKTPVLGRFFTDVGFVEGTRDATIKMLKQGELIGMAPGGMRESLRSNREKYTFDWKGRTGFVAVAMRAGAPIVLAACPRSDDCYEVLANPVTPWAYRNFKVPAPLALGRWLTPLPRPVKLWHLLSEPIWPDVAPDQVEERDVVALHQKVTERMDRLMRDSLALGPTELRA